MADFDKLASAATVSRLKGLLEAAGDLTEKAIQTFNEAKDTLAADDMEELRPLMERIVPRAIQAGKDLDAYLEQAKTR